MICPNCGYKNEAAPTADTRCAFCGYRGETAETLTEQKPDDVESSRRMAMFSALPEMIGAATLAVAPTPAIPAILGAVEAPAPPVEPIAL